MHRKNAILISVVQHGLICVTWLVLLLIASPAAGQDKNPSFASTLSFTGSVHYGFYSAHDIKLQSILDSRPILAELDISSQTTGKKIWEQMNGYPVLGLGLIYGNSGSRQYLGHIAALFPFLNARLIHQKGFELRGKLGIGIGWVEKPFNPVTNYQNLVIGSHWNACINLGLLTEWRLDPHVFLDFGFSFTHLSNGSTKVPNLGLNIPALVLGLKYTPNPHLARIHQSIPFFHPTTSFLVFVSGAIKEAHPIESASYLVSLINLELIRQYSHTGRIGAGVNFTHDPTQKVEVPNSSLYAFDHSKPRLEISLYGSYEYVMGKWSIPLQLGVYLYNNYVVSWIYQDIGIRYAIGSHFVLAAGLKTHYFNADFLHWGLGYQF